MTSIQLSIVTTLYNSEKTIVDFYHRITQAAINITPDYELILVNDGSTDRSLDIATSFLAGDQHCTLVDLSRNFGQHPAIMEGLSHATGERIFLLDSDLEEDQGQLLRFWAELDRLGTSYDVVYGVQEKRKGRWFEVVSGELAYIVLNLFSEKTLPHNPVLMRLMTRRFVDVVLLHKDKSIAYLAVHTLAGFKQASLAVIKKD